MRRFLHFIAGLIGIVAVLAFIEYFPTPRYSYFWDRTYDTGHILVFGIGVMMSLTMIRAFFGTHAIRAQYIGAGIFTLLLGIVVEIWQAFHNRTAEWVDVFSDFIGIVAFSAIYAILDKRLGQERKGWLKRRALATFALVTLFIGLLPFFQTLNLYLSKHRTMPNLIDWELPWYPYFYYERSAKFSVVEPPAKWPKENRPNSVAQLVIGNEHKYPGFVFREPHPNWTGGYRALEIDVLYKEDQPHDFFFRIHDYQHDETYDDRFNKQLTLSPGFQVLRFEFDEMRRLQSGRDLDFRHIGGFGLFTLDIPEELTIYIGDMRLVSE